MKHRKLKVILPIIVGATVIAGGVTFYLYNYGQSDLVYSEVYVEAGTSACDVSEFLKQPEASAHFSEDTVFDPNVPGDYELTIVWDDDLRGEQSATSTLHVQDTTAPVVTLTADTIDIFPSVPAPTAADLVESVIDCSTCTIDYKEAYDFTTEGSFDVTIVVTDACGNSTESTVPCTVTVDNTPPVITGVEPLEVAQGEPISYKKNIEVTDDYDPNPTLEVDTTEVNSDKRGTYDVTYIATDAAGNETRETTTIKIVSAKITEATEETVYAMADEVLAEIITEDMTPKEQARAVFDWVVYNISYSESAGIDDLLSAAYKGLHSRVGDCTVKQKTAEVLLNRLGIKNMEIEKIRDFRGHYWLLIDIGEGWYHFDPNLQLDGTLIFYWHDADLWEYSNAHNNTHNYDPSKYPEIQ